MHTTFGFLHILQTLDEWFQYTFQYFVHGLEAVTRLSGGNSGKNKEDETYDLMGAIATIFTMFCMELHSPSLQTKRVYNENNIM